MLLIYLLQNDPGHNDGTSPSVCHFSPSPGSHFLNPAFRRTVCLPYVSTCVSKKKNPKTSHKHNQVSFYLTSEILRNSQQKVFLTCKIDSWAEEFMEGNGNRRDYAFLVLTLMLWALYWHYMIYWHKKKNICRKPKDEETFSICQRSWGRTRTLILCFCWL